MPAWASSPLSTQDLTTSGTPAPQLRDSAQASLSILRSSLRYQGARAARPLWAPGHHQAWPSANSMLGAQVQQHWSRQDAHCPRHNKPSTLLRGPGSPHPCCEFRTQPLPLPLWEPEAVMEGPDANSWTRRAAEAKEVEWGVKGW